MKKILYIILLCFLHSGFVISNLSATKDDQNSEIGLEISLPVALVISTIFITLAVYKIAKRINAKNNLRVKGFLVDEKTISGLLQNALIELKKPGVTFVLSYEKLLSQIDAEKRIATDSKNFLKAVIREIYYKFEKVGMDIGKLREFLNDRAFLDPILIKSAKTLGFDLTEATLKYFLPDIEIKNGSEAVLEDVTKEIGEPIARSESKIVLDAQPNYNFVKENYEKLLSSLITDKVEGDVYAGVKDGEFYLKAGNKYYRVQKNGNDLKLFKLKNGPDVEFGIKALNITQNQRTGLYRIDLFSPDGRLTQTTTISDGRLIRQSRYHNDPTGTGFYRIDPDGVMHIISEEEGLRFER